MSPRATRSSPRPRPNISTRRTTTFPRRPACRGLSTRTAINTAALLRAVPRRCYLLRSAQARMDRTLLSSSISGAKNRCRTCAIIRTRFRPFRPRRDREWERLRRPWRCCLRSRDRGRADSVLTSTTTSTTISSMVIEMRDLAARVPLMHTRRRVRVLWRSTLLVRSRRREPVPLDESSPRASRSERICRATSAPGRRTSTISSTSSWISRSRGWRT